jgi:5-deoxy-glucuronate isomerase
MSSQTIAADKCIVRDTAARKGRTRSVTPGETPAQHLHYGRIILDAGAEPARFETGTLETGLICLRGDATVRVDAGETPHALGRYDSLYVPRDSAVQVKPGPEGCDLVEIAAPVTRRHPIQVVRFDDVVRDPGLHFETGGPAARRELNVLIGKNVQAGRIMAGITFSQPGNWTSWPPHEHSAILEEAYLYVEMPPPGFGVQLVYTNTREPEIATIVREGDVVLMPGGYHPNVAAPGSAINFIWMMAANREDVDRQYGVVNVQPDFAAIGSGLDAGRSEKR